MAAAGVLLLLCLGSLVVPDTCVPAEWVRVDVFPEEERELPNVFLDFSTFRAGTQEATVGARLVNPDSSYAEILITIHCARNEFDVPQSRFYDSTGSLVRSEPTAEAQWLGVPRGSHIEFIKFFLCDNDKPRSARDFRKMRGFRDFALMSKTAPQTSSQKP